MVYLVVYLLIVVIGILINYSCLRTKVSKQYSFISFFIMSLVLGLRSSNVGEDTQHYINIFNVSKNITWHSLAKYPLRFPYFTDKFGFTDTVETAYILICKVIHIFTSSPQVYLFIIALATCILVAKFIQDNSVNIYISVIIALTEFFFMISFNSMRQMLAGAIGIQAYTLLKQGKNKQALLINILAVLIHNTAIIYFMMYPVFLINQNYEKKLFKWFFIIALASPFLIVGGKQIIMMLMPRYAGYFNNNYWENSLGGSSILLVFELVLVFMFYKKNFMYENSFRLSIFVVFYLTLEISGLQLSALGRLAWYFRFFLIIFFPLALKMFNRKNRQIVFWTLIILLSFMYYSYATVPSRIYNF